MRAKIVGLAALGIVLASPAFCGQLEGFVYSGGVGKIRAGGAKDKTTPPRPPERSSSR